MIKKDRIPVLFQASLYWLALAVFKIFFRFKVGGQENLKEVENGPIIFASNHVSYIDGGINAASLPRNSFWPKKFFPIRFLVTDRFFQWKYFPLNIFLMAIGSIKIKRAKIKLPNNEHLFGVLSEAIKELNGGKKVWIYPEGGFNNDGTPKKPRNGVAFLHQQTKAPIVPVRVIENEKIMSKRAPFLPAFKSLIGLNRVKVVFGKPIYLLDTSNLDESTAILMDRINGLI